MTALSIDMTTQERTTGWESISPTTHPETVMRALALSCWKCAAQLADEPEPNWKIIADLQDLARYMEELDRGEPVEEETHAEYRQRVHDETP